MCIHALLHSYTDCSHHSRAPITGPGHTSAAKCESVKEALHFYHTQPGRCPTEWPYPCPTTCPPVWGTGDCLGNVVSVLRDGKCESCKRLDSLVSLAKLLRAKIIGKQEGEVVNEARHQEFRAFVQKPAAKGIVEEMREYIRENPGLFSDFSLAGAMKRVFGAPVLWEGVSSGLDWFFIGLVDIFGSALTERERQQATQFLQYRLSPGEKAKDIESVATALWSPATAAVSVTQATRIQKLLPSIWVAFAAAPSAEEMRNAEKPKGKAKWQKWRKRQREAKNLKTIFENHEVSGEEEEEKLNNNTAATIAAAADTIKTQNGSNVVLRFSQPEPTTELKPESTGALTLEDGEKSRTAKNGEPVSMEQTPAVPLVTTDAINHDINKPATAAVTGCESVGSIRMLQYKSRIMEDNFKQTLENCDMSDQLKPTTSTAHAQSSQHTSKQPMPEQSPSSSSPSSSSSEQPTSPHRPSVSPPISEQWMFMRVWVPIGERAPESEQVSPTNVATVKLPCTGHHAHYVGFSPPLPPPLSPGPSHLNNSAALTQGIATVDMRRGRKGAKAIRIEGHRPVNGGPAAAETRKDNCGAMSGGWNPNPPLWLWRGY